MIFFYLQTDYLLFSSVRMAGKKTKIIVKKLNNISKNRKLPSIISIFILFISLRISVKISCFNFSISICSIPLTLTVSSSEPQRFLRVNK